MADQGSTLNTFIERLSGFSDKELIFLAEGEGIRADYHVTEVKLAHIRGLDCGKQTAEWNETLIQLLDGPKTPSENASFMNAGKFMKIALAGKSKLPSEDDGELYFEFAPDNKAMRKLSVQLVEEREGQLFVELGPVAALCKPALRSKTPASDAQPGCCAPAPKDAKIRDGGACCAPVSEGAACCA